MNDRFEKDGLINTKPSPYINAYYDFCDKKERWYESQIIKIENNKIYIKFCHETENGCNEIM